MGRTVAGILVTWGPPRQAPPRRKRTDQGHAIHQGNIDEESNGCVRLNQEPAQTFYSQLDPGETVQIVA